VGPFGFSAFRGLLVTRAAESSRELEETEDTWPAGIKAPCLLARSRGRLACRHALDKRKPVLDRCKKVDKHVRVEIHRDEQLGSCFLRRSAFSHHQEVMPSRAPRHEGAAALRP
jgi:hypothetical protein